MNIQEITSTQNDLVKYVVKLQNPKFRKQEKLILADGYQTIQGFIDDKINFKYVFSKKDNSLLNNINVENIIYVNDEILKKISTTKTPVDIVGVINEPIIDKKILFQKKRIALIDGIKDAGNLGTIIRSAVAFSIDAIILFSDCVDLYNSKTIRATAQNIFKIPIIRTSDIEFIKELKKNHELIATVVNSNNEFTKHNFNKDFILAFGSEAFGISKEILDISDKKVTFSMDNQVESLNLAVCASISFAMINYLKNNNQ